MANTNVVVIYDQLQSAMKKLDNYYTMLEEQQKMISRLDTYFDYLYKIHGKNTTFTATMEDKIQSMALAVKNDMADIDYLKNLIDYIIQSYTDVEGQITLRSNDLLMSALGSLVPYTSSFSTNIYNNANEYAAAIKSDSSKAADVSQYKDTKNWKTYASANAKTADAWDAVHDNTSVAGEKNSFKISSTGSKITTAAMSVAVADMGKDVTEAKEKVDKAQKEKETAEKERETVVKEKEALEKERQEAEERLQAAEKRAQEAEEKADSIEKEAKSAENEQNNASQSESNNTSQNKSKEYEEPVQKEESTTTPKEEPVTKEKPKQSSGEEVADPVDPDNPSESGATDVEDPGSATSDPSETIDPSETGTPDPTEEPEPLPTPEKKSSSGNKVVPIIAGVAAAGAAGVGAKVFLDRKSNSNIDDDEEFDGDWETNENNEITDETESITTETPVNEENVLDSSDEFTYKTDLDEDYNDEDYDDDTFSDVTEEEDVQGYQAINFNDISETH